MFGSGAVHGTERSLLAARGMLVSGLVWFKTRHGSAFGLTGRGRVGCVRVWIEKARFMVRLDMSTSGVMGWDKARFRAW